MPPQIALVVFGVFIATLFYLDRDRTKVSGALWIPTIWIMIGASRNVAEWFYPGSDVSYTEGNALDRNVLSCLIGAGVIVAGRRGSRVLSLLRANLPILIFILYCLLSVLWSEFPLVGARRWFRLAGDLVMAIVLLTDLNPGQAVAKVLTRAAFILIPASLMLIRYFPEYGRNYGVDGSLYWGGVAGGKNGLGALCLVFGTVLLWRIFEALETEGATRVRRIMAYGMVLVVGAYLMKVADSMTSIACFSIGAALVVMTRMLSIFRRRPLFHVMVAGAVFVPAAILFLGVGGGALETIGRDPTLTGRTQIWQIVLRFVDNPILGAGYEGFWLGSRLEEIARLHTYMNQAHNGYIEVYLNLGWIGVLLLAAVILKGYGNVARSRDTVFGSLRLAFFVIALVYNCTEGAFKFMYPIWTVFLLSALSYPLVVNATSRVGVVPSPRKWLSATPEELAGLPQ